MARPRLLFLLATAVLAAAPGCYPAPADVANAEMVLDLSDAMDDLRNESAMLQEQIDSLSLQVARQDSIIRRLADHVGMSVPR